MWTRDRNTAMTRTHMKRSLRNRVLPAMLFICTAFASTAVLAGEIKVGQDKELETTDKGALTGAARKAAVTELDNVPGEDLWVCYLWAQIDRGAEGPLYIEFFQEINGGESIVHRHEETGYDGGKFIKIPIELEGNIGFNKDRNYTIKIVQANAKGNDIVLGKTKIKLIKSGRKASDDEGDEGGSGGGGGDAKKKDDLSEQDIADSLAGPEEAGQKKAPDEEETGEEAPPPVEPKKGCSVTAESPSGFSGPLVLLLAAAGLTFGRRKRS